MGVTVVGLDELIRDLEAVPAKGPAKFRKVVSKGALNVKMAWRRRWLPEIGRPPQNLPHAIRGLGYDTYERGTRLGAHIGVHHLNPQAALVHFPEFGSVNNPPTPAGMPSLLEEEPRFAQAVADAAVDLLEGR